MPGKKPLTKAQVVSYFANKFDLSKKVAASVIDEMATLAVAETKKAGAFTFPGIGKLRNSVGSITKVKNYFMS